MGTLKLYTKFEYTSNSNTYTDGSIASTLVDSDALQKTFGDEIYDRSFALAQGQSTPETLWSDSIKPSDFDFLWIVSTVDDVDIQFVTNEGGTTGANNVELGYVFRLKASCPFILMSNSSMNGGNIGGDMDAEWATEIDIWNTAWIVDTIDRIQAVNKNGSAAANVRIFAVT
ncbi:MAG: hypothetical protein GOVbin2833_43 [Prokaryotic dsDNA virus sp.]|nr:MAG: hypothetical protein GOVbin2833_43 [Prokaryotic dsDNA virus sp.]|tara:strand:+ start:9906 stop:10421 length:516 start_codon:yes stop_codon:yes gene_type:complete